MITLGIDIGTTSVKIVLVQAVDDEFEILSSMSARHEADIVDPDMPAHSEQSPAKIWSTLENCMTELESVMESALSKVERICVCGQMHGCMLWDNSHIGENNLFSSCSTLATWRDQRCDMEFLNTLPDPENSVPISTGFGCATLFWLKRKYAEILSKYNCSGTIMDYFVASLCDLKKPLMSTQNAMSWGYYDFCKAGWNRSILQSNGFPVELLPDIINAGEPAGSLQQEWHGLPSGTCILGAFGDMQCSVLSCRPQESEGVFNLSTSAQLSTVSSLELGKQSYLGTKDAKLPASIVCVPYFGSLCLRTSASLNGGAVLELLVTALLQWTQQFVPTATIDDIYEKLNEGDSQTSSELIILPTVFGERHCPDAKGSISAIGATPISFSGFGQQLGESIIQNVADMFAKGENIPTLERIWACGTAFRNSIFRNALQKVFDGVECRFDKEMDAALGAALLPCLIDELV